MLPTSVVTKNQHSCNGCTLYKKINDEKDVIHFKTRSPAYKNIIFYVELLCERILGTGNKTYNHKYTIKNEVFIKCADFMKKLKLCSDETDLTLSKSAGTLRFGHVAFRVWFDKMKDLCEDFINEISDSRLNDQYKQELLVYLTESFGNRMRIDYGTGHELNFIIFTMGLCNLVELSIGDESDLIINREKLKALVETYGWDIHALFAKDYLRLCREVQKKFRLEPAGSRGVYNMDDFQFLPFLFGSAQLTGIKYISTSNFYLREQVDDYKDDYIFFEAVDFILNNKRGPFNEHSYTLWGFTNLGTWDNIFRRVKFKFTDDILNPFPIIQHFLFGDYILIWEDAK